MGMSDGACHSKAESFHQTDHSNPSAQVAGSSSLNAALHVLPLVPAPRSTFDDTRGCLLVEDLACNTCKPNTPAYAPFIKSHYLAFGAAGALLQHLTTSAGAVVAPSSLRVEYGTVSRHHMMLDHDSVAALELVRPLLRPSAAGRSTSKGASLQAAAAVGGGDGWGGKRYASSRMAAATAARFSSLLAFLDHTSTACGARLLRTNILQVRPGHGIARIHAS